MLLPVPEVSFCVWEGACALVGATAGWGTHGHFIYPLLAQCNFFPYTIIDIRSDFVGKFLSIIHTCTHFRRFGPQRSRCHDLHIHC